MSGETELRPSARTTDTLNEYVNQRFRDLEKYVDQRFSDMEKAVVTANTATEKRFDSVNEFRGQLNDQVATFLPRKEYDARHETLENRVSELNDRLNRTEGVTKGSEVTMGKLYAAIAAVGAILAIIVLLANNVFK